MPCNCGGKKNSNGTQPWVHTPPEGRSTTYPTEIQAKAAQVDQGGPVKPKS
jgi:hypothetical protein